MNKQGILNSRRGACPLLLMASLLFCVLSASAQQNPPPAVVPQQEDSLAALINRATRTDVSFGEQIQLLAAFLAVDPSIQPQIQKAVADSVREGPSTNQQNGATAEASGTTTLTEKPGIAELLNLAIESGAIIKTTSGTSFTLQTTPYMLYSRFGAWDTAQTWDTLTPLRRISLSATFDQGTSGTDATRNNFQKGEVKYTWGERSPRDKEFRKRLRPILENTIDAASSRANSDLQSFYNGLTQQAREAFDRALSQFNDWRRGQKTIDRGDLAQEVQKVIEPLRAQLRAEDVTSLDRLRASLGAEGKAFAEASQHLTADAKSYLAEPHPMISLSYSLLRDPMSTDSSNIDLSDIKLIVGYDTGAKFTFNLNGEATVNNRRNNSDGTRLDRVRSFSLAGDLTLGKFAKDTADFTLAAKVTRPEGESHQTTSAQTKLNLYLVRGIVIPIALTYSNRTENSSRSVVRFNVGLSMKADTFMGVAKNNP